MSGRFADELWQLVLLAGFALVANSSALVWGPNMVYLMQKRRGLSRSVAYTVGRGLVLTLWSAVVLGAVLAGGHSVNAMADRVSQLAKDPHPGVDIAIAAGLIVAGWWVWVRPPKFLDRTPPVPGDSASTRIWPAFVLGATIFFANLLEFAWQTLGVGGFAATHARNYGLIALAALLWTTMGTATLWAPAIAHVLAPTWANERFEHLIKRIPKVKAWEIALPLILGGVMWGVYATWKYLH